MEITRSNFKKALKELAERGEVLKLYNVYNRVIGNRAWVGDNELIKQALIDGIKVCGEKGWISNVADLLKRKGLSDAVLIAGIKVYGEKGRVDVVADLLKREGLSRAVRRKGMEVLNVKDKTLNIINQYLERNRLAGDGMMVDPTNRLARGVVGQKKMELGRVQFIQNPKN